ncbi:hypothetical protein ACEPPN_009358 [Leptodophora sp. 'Broadleaf-Isolate-01']
MNDHSTFLPFPRLPTELRLKIWHLAQSEREIIPIECASFAGEPRNAAKACSRKRHLVVPARAVPSLFHVCLESREICLPKYIRGFKIGGRERNKVVQCSHQRMVTRAVQGEMKVVTKRDMYWRPTIDVLLVTRGFTHGATSLKKVLSASSVLFVYGAPCGGLQAYGAQHVAMPLEWFHCSQWDPSLCEYTWGMTTVYVILKQKEEDAAEDWESHLAWFGRWWLRVSAAWREIVGKDAPLEERVPFLPKAVGLLQGETLQNSHLDAARECVLVEAAYDGEVEDDDDRFLKRRYGSHLWAY